MAKLLYTRGGPNLYFEGPMTPDCVYKAYRLFLNKDNDNAVIVGAVDDDGTFYDQADVVNLVVTNYLNDKHARDTADANIPAFSFNGVLYRKAS